MRIDDGVTQATWSRDGRTLHIRTEGAVTLRGTLDGIAAMDAGSRFVLREETPDGEVHEVTLTPGDDGPAYAYRRNGSPAPFDADAKQWMRETLPEAARKLGVGIPERVAYLTEQGGVDAVLAEMETVESDAAYRRYAVASLSAANTPMDVRNRVLRHASGRLDSDHETRRLLASVAPAYVSAPEHFAVFAEAAQTIDSDHERRRLLAPLVSTPALVAVQYDALLELATAIDSDHEKRRTLHAMTEASGLPERSFDLLVGILDAIASDVETRRVLTDLLPRSDLSAAQRAALIRRAAAIGSDVETRRVVEMVVRESGFEATPFDELLQIVNAINSDVETRRILHTLFDAVGDTPNRLVALLDVARRIGSDVETSRTLLRVTHLHSHDDASVRQAFDAALRSISSDWERERVERALR